MLNFAEGHFSLFPPKQEKNLRVSTDQSIEKLFRVVHLSSRNGGKEDSRCCTPGQPQDSKRLKCSCRIVLFKALKNLSSCKPEINSGLPSMARITQRKSVMSLLDFPSTAKNYIFNRHVEVNQSNIKSHSYQYIYNISTF